MANFLLDLAAGIQGVQAYDKLKLQQEALKQSVEEDKLRLQNLKDATEQAKKAKKRDEESSGLLLDYFRRDVPQGIPPPPQLGGVGAPQVLPDQPPPVQAPMPGTQSQPMAHPQMRMIGPDMEGGLPPPPMQRPVMGPDAGFEADPTTVGPQTPPGGTPGAPPVQGGPQPYQTVQGASMAAQGPASIPPPPQVGPRPNSMSIQDAAQFIQGRGITDPVVGMQVLEKLTPYLNAEAKAEAAQLRQDLAQQKLEADKARDERIAKDKTLDREQREAAAKRIDETRRALGNMRMVPKAGGKGATAGTSAGAGAASAGTGKPGEIDRQDDIEVQAWKFLTKGESPPARSPDYKTVMQRVALIAKDNGLTPQEIISASADVKSKLAAKKNFEIRAQNMERAENQILAEIPLIRDAVKQINLPSIPVFAKGGMAALRQLGDPRVTALDQAVETVFNEFEGIRTGNPGALNVSDVQNARHAYENAKTPQQLEAAIKGIERTIANAKTAMSTTRKHILDDVNATFKKEGLGGHTKAAPTSQGLKLPTSKAELKTGQIYQTARGPAKWNGTAFEAQ